MKQSWSGGYENNTVIGPEVRLSAIWCKLDDTEDFSLIVRSLKSQLCNCFVKWFRKHKNVQL